MTLATMANRSLPLAERVQAALLCWDMDDAHEAARDALLADIAAADGLARAVDAYWRTVGVYDASEDAGEWDGLLEAMGRVRVDLDSALAAYRARMAQGVARG